MDKKRERKKGRKSGSWKKNKRKNVKMRQQFDTIDVDDSFQDCTSFKRGKSYTISDKGSKRTIRTKGYAEKGLFSNNSPVKKKVSYYP